MDDHTRGISGRLSVAVLSKKRAANGAADIDLCIEYFRFNIQQHSAAKSRQIHNAVCAACSAPYDAVAQHALSHSLAPSDVDSTCVITDEPGVAAERALPRLRTDVVYCKIAIYESWMVGRGA